MAEFLVVPALLGYGEAAFAYAGELRGPGLAGRLATLQGQSDKASDSSSSALGV